MQNIPCINDADIGMITSIKYMRINPNSETIFLDNEYFFFHLKLNIINFSFKAHYVTYDMAHDKTSKTSTILQLKSLTEFSWEF